MKNKYVRSPIFYMGNKYRLLSQLLPLFPEKCATFVDLFGGSGVVTLNYVGAERFVYNELNQNIFALFSMFKEEKAEDVISRVQQNIQRFDLNREGIDVKQNTPSAESNRQYYSKSYLKFRDYYNSSNRDIRDLFTLTFYSFSNLIRFNQNSDFNMPYGNRCFTSEHKKIIIDWHNEISKKQIQTYNLDYLDLLIQLDLTSEDFVYCDCPYLNTTAIYNEKRAFGGWDINNDYDLFKKLEELNNKGVKWGLSNVFKNKGITNQHLIDWCSKNNWYVHHLQMNYSALGKGNAQSDEVYICNYDIKQNKTGNKKLL